jgi:hypothetical protein
VGIRTFLSPTMRSVWRTAMVPMPNGSWPPSGTTILATSSAPPFRCRSSGNRGAS